MVSIVESEVDAHAHDHAEMELKKLHMGTMSYGADSMDEVAHQLALAFGLSSEQGEVPFSFETFNNILM